MLTLSDINRLTNSHDGDIYSDLYKSVNGFRPRNVGFDSVAHFNTCFSRLSEELDHQLIEERAAKAANWAKFLARVDEITKLVNCDTARAVEILADAEGISKDELSFYGWEVLEYNLGITYGSIKPFLAAEAENASFLQEVI